MARNSATHRALASTVPRNDHLSVYFGCAAYIAKKIRRDAIDPRSMVVDLSGIAYHAKKLGCARNTKRRVTANPCMDLPYGVFPSMIGVSIPGYGVVRRRVMTR